MGALNNQVVSGEQYEKVPTITKQQRAFWNNQRNFHIGLHSLQAVANARLDVNYTAEEWICLMIMNRKSCTATSKN